MKKFLAILVIFTTLFAFAACDKNKNLTPEEISASEAAAVSKARAEYESSIAASIKHEEDIAEDRITTLESLGKTEKGKKLVFKSHTEKVEYHIIMFDADGKASSWKKYRYYQNERTFDAALKGTQTGNFVFERSDASYRLIVTRNANEAAFKGTDFDTMLQLIIDQKYTVIE